MRNVSQTFPDKIKEEGVNDKATIEQLTTATTETVSKITYKTDVVAGEQHVNIVV